MYKIDYYRTGRFFDAKGFGLGSGTDQRSEQFRHKNTGSYRKCEENDQNVR